MNKITELQQARLKVIQAQEKLNILRKRGKSSRDEEVKYWKEQHTTWSAYERELSSLGCATCNASEIDLGKTIMDSGAFHVCATCPNCGHNIKGGGQWISKKSIPAEVLDLLPIVVDYRTHRCEVCNELGAELHHWAPKELFPETFELWPKSYLCPQHHQEWHQTVTNPLRLLRRRQERNGNGQPHA